MQKMYSKGCYFMIEEKELDSIYQKDDIVDMGSVTMKDDDHTIHCLTIVGQIEGHQILPSDTKTTKYEHVMPQLAAIEKFIKKPLPLSDFPRLDYSDWKVSAPTKPQTKNRRPGPRRNGPAGFKRSDGKPSVRRRTARGQ